MKCRDKCLVKDDYTCCYKCDRIEKCGIKACYIGKEGEEALKCNSRVEEKKDEM